MSTALVIATRNRLSQLQLAMPTWPTSQRTIIVDDASDDGSIELLAGYAKEYPNVEVHTLTRQPGYRKNPSFVLNTGHLLTDADVIVEQGGEIVHLTDCVGPLVAACRPGIVALARVHNGTPEEMRKVRDEIRLGLYEFRTDTVVAHPITNGDKLSPVPKVGRHAIQLYCGAERLAPFLFCGAIHREDFDAVGGYDEALPRRNDEDLANRLVARSVQFLFLGSAIAFHLSHGKS